MAFSIGFTDLMQPLLLAKALLAWLSSFIFLYYWYHWQRAKHKLPVHFFFTRWRAVRHALFLGLASLCFAVGFSIELAGPAIGLPSDAASIASSAFEALSLFCMLYVFFTLALEDVPHFQRIAESEPRAPHPKPSGQGRRHKKRARKKRKGRK